MIARCEQDGREGLALTIRFLSIVGARISEAVSIRTDDITDSGIIIQGKGTRSQPVRERSFPMIYAGQELFPGLSDVVRRLLAISATARPGYLLPFRNADAVQRQIRELRRQLGLPDDRRSTHSFRKAAEYVWEFVLLLPESVIEDLAGHGHRVRKAHYRIDPGLDHVARTAAHHLLGSDAVDKMASKHPYAGVRRETQGDGR